MDMNQNIENERKHEITSQDLSSIMFEHGLVIRAIPNNIQLILEVIHEDKFPDGKIEYLKDYKRRGIF